MPRGSLALGRWCKWTRVWDWQRKQGVEVPERDLQQMRLRVCVAQVEGYLEQSKDYK